MELLQFDQILEHTDLVITGEGRADQQTLMGKLPFAIMQRAKRMGVPTLLLAGQVSDREALLHAGFYDVLCIHPTPISIKEAMKKENALMHIKQTTQDLIEYSCKNKQTG
jgi:glycerate kinase